MRLSGLLIIAGIGVSCLGAYWLGSRGDSEGSGEQSKPRKQVIEGLAVDMAHLDLGEVWEEPEFIYDLPIENHTLTEVQILDFLVSCGCLAVHPRTLIIPANDRAVVRLKLDLSHRTPREIGLAKRPLGVEVRPVLKGGAPRGPGWKIEGVVNSRVTLDTLQLDFGEALAQGQSPTPRRLTARVHASEGMLEPIVEPAVATVQLTRRPNDPVLFDVVISPQPTLSPGLFEAKVTFELMTPNGESQRAVTLPIRGNVLPEVWALPARVMLGGKLIGETAETYVVLQAPSAAKFMVERIEIDSPDVHIEPAEIEGTLPGRTFRVKQRVTKEGDCASTARFVIRKKTGQPPIVLSMEVCYLGQLAKEPQ